MRGGLRQFALGVASAASLLGAAHDFPAPAQIRYDARCLTLEGQDVFISAIPFDGGSMDMATGRERLRKIKAAGFNAVAVAAAVGPRLPEWLHAVHREFGLYSVLDEVPDLPAAVAAITPEQMTRAPGQKGIILVRLPGRADPRAEYRRLREGGIDVPVFSLGSDRLRDNDDPLLGQIFDGLRLGAVSPVPGLTALASAQPDAPLLVERSQPLSSPGEEMLQALLMIQEGATVLSIDWSPAAWPLASKLNRTLAQYGPELARTHRLTVQAQTGSADVTLVVRKARNGATYLFLANQAQTAARRGRASLWLDHEGVEFGVDYGLPPRTARVMRLPPNSTDTSQVQQLLGE